MRIPLKKISGKFAAMTLVSLIAIAVMYVSSTRWWLFFDNLPETTNTASQNIELSKAPVAVKLLREESIEITATYSGMIEPFERYRYAFDIAGRVEALGKNPQDKPWDEGDTVEAGDMLATLDRRALQAQLQEVNVRKEQAEVELDRVKRLIQSNPGAISDSELRQRETDVLVAKAQAAQAAKNLSDATLKATAQGVISKRFFKAGESVNPREPVFDVIQVDRVLLVVGVPQSRIGALLRRQKETDLDKSLKFQVYIKPAHQNSFTPSGKPLEGEVYRIAARSDDTSGLFNVEVVIPNAEGLLRPGMIAVAKIVTDRVDAYRVDSASVMFQNRKAYLFSIVEEKSDVELLFWNLGPEASYSVRRWELSKDNYVEQGKDLIIFQLEKQNCRVVVRGQHRLVDGRGVTIVPNYTLGNSE